MIININNKAAYYHAPKCASRTVLGWVILIKHPDLIEKYPEVFEENRKEGHNDIELFLNKFAQQSLTKIHLTRNWKKEVPVVESDYRFCIIRDPIDRFISAFANRVLFFKKISLKSGKPFDLETFISKFDYIQENSLDISVHFRPQYYYYGDLDKFHHVYKMNELDKLKKRLEEIFNTKLPSLHLQKSHNVIKPVLNENQIDWVKNKYSIDYDNYQKYFMN